MADSNPNRKTVKKNLTELIKTYKQNISDNENKIRVIGGGNLEIELKAENECLRMVIKEIEEAMNI